MENEIHGSEIRYVRDCKCQVSVGELYRWILAKLTDKDIKRALHKYRDLMPRQSDWNRKLTQATNMPELGFRYLYRCGQIDESNHRTMQKMLKYIDRQDVLPYFDTILYNTNCSNASMDTLKSVLIDRVDSFLMKSDLDCDSYVHPDLPYEICQCQPVENIRVTRSRSKRKSSEDSLPKCITMVKKARRSSVSSSCGGNTSTCSTPTSSGRPGGTSASGSKATAGSPSNHPGGIVGPFPVMQLGPPLMGPGYVYHQNRVVPGGAPLFLRRLPVPGNNVAPAPPGLNLNPGQAHLRIGAGLNVSSDLGTQGAAGGGGYRCRLRMRIRMHNPTTVKDALRAVRSDRQDPFERQLDIFSQSSALLRQRETGEVVCDVQFTDLQYLESFWRDYITGTLKQSMRDILLLDAGATSFHQAQFQPPPAAPPAPPAPQGQVPGAAPAHRPWPPPPGHAPAAAGVSFRRGEHDLHIFISKQEYENCREILLQNIASRSHLVTDANQLASSVQSHVVGRVMAPFPFNMGGGGVLANGIQPVLNQPWIQNMPQVPIFPN